MGARVTITVALPPNQPVEGADITGVNHDSWSSSHRTWRGRTLADGSFTWANMDTGTLGDRYTFKVSYTDPEGVAWNGSISERVNRPLTLRVVLAPAYAESRTLAKALIHQLGETKGGRRIVGTLGELDTALNANLVQTALLVEVATIELAIKLKLELAGQYRNEWDHLGPSVLLTFKQVRDALGEPLVDQVDELYRARNLIVHGPGRESVAAVSQQGRRVAIAVIEALFGASK